MLMPVQVNQPNPWRKMMMMIKMLVTMTSTVSLTYLQQPQIKNFVAVGFSTVTISTELQLVVC